MGSGKSSFGRRVATRLGYEFIDLDDYLVKEEGKTVNQIFDEQGEEGFRKLESKYLKKIISEKKDVIFSLGGGTPCFDKNWKQISKTTSIYLNRDKEFLLSILAAKKSERPLIKNLSEAELDEFIVHKLEERDPFYKRADVIFHVSQGKKKKIVKSLLSVIENFIV